MRLLRAPTDANPLLPTVPVTYRKDGVARVKSIPFLRIVAPLIFSLMVGPSTRSQSVTVPPVGKVRAGDHLIPLGDHLLPAVRERGLPWIASRTCLSRKTHRLRRSSSRSFAGTMGMISTSAVGGSAEGSKFPVEDMRDELVIVVAGTHNTPVALFLVVFVEDGQRLPDNLMECGLLDHRFKYSDAAFRGLVKDNAPLLLVLGRHQKCWTSSTSTFMLI